ncbi:hypothetical protein OIO90_001354 [Microbotryomycetes sp. JL221]|nr:hypothetical protein OIO90_001354 [Microbotryomycetes sp. JL221]
MTSRDDETPKRGLQAITLLPRAAPETAGRFRVWLYIKSEDQEHDDDEVAPVLVWDRKTEGGFPELKELKQRIRNFINPDHSLGHSDKTSSKKAASSDVSTTQSASTGEQTQTEPDPFDYTPRFRC